MANENVQVSIFNKNMFGSICVFDLHKLMWKVR